MSKKHVLEFIASNDNNKYSVRTAACFSEAHALGKLIWAFCISVAYLITSLSNFFLFSHNKSNGTFCCGSEIYDHHKQVCCSGRRFDKSSGECCGNLLLKRNTEKICCSSSTHGMIYDEKRNHHCCGHYYYNTSLWSCCAEHLKPTPIHKSSHAGHMLKPMMDLIPDLCNKTVLFGKVESMTLYADKRYIVLKVGNVGKEPWLHISLDHCSSPALETGMTYLWERINNEYKPLSISVDIISDMHMLYTVCDKLKCQKGG